MYSSSINLENWLALYHSHGVGAVHFHKYLQQDQTLNQLPPDLKPNWDGVSRDLKWLQHEATAQILTLNDMRYPTVLKYISNPPPILYVLGDASCLSEIQIAVVGSRYPSSLGLENAKHFSQQLANLGIVITSGLALGIDAAGHRGALAVPGGKTIAVLAHGMDSIYPERNYDLAKQIISNGCLVSEFPLGTTAIPGHFPRRNRIISGLSRGVLVVEAALNSGSLITARYAVEQNKEVFAIPGSIKNPKVRGCHQLLRQGAKLVETVEDILEELVDLLNYDIRDKTASSSSASPINGGLTAEYQQLLDFIDYDSTCVDVIAGRTGLDTRVVSAIVLELELLGLITAVPGGYARKSD